MRLRLIPIFIIIAISFFRSWLNGSSCLPSLSSIETLSLLLAPKTLRLFITLTNVVSCIHLEKVKPAISFFVLEMSWADVYYTLIVRIWSPIGSSISSHILLLFFYLMFFSNFTCTYPSIPLACDTSTRVLVIIAHCGSFFSLSSSEITFYYIFSQVFFEMLLTLIHKLAPLLIDFLKEELNAPLFLPIDLLSNPLPFFLICS